MGLWDEIKDFGGGIVEGFVDMVDGPDDDEKKQPNARQILRPQYQGDAFATVNPAFQKRENEFEKPLWMQGADQQSPYSSWDTGFLDRMFKQQEKLADKGELNSQFDRKNATGVVTWDHVTDGGKQLKFGDIFDDGKLIGNLYEDKAGTQADADLMMAQFLLEPEELAQIGQDRDPATRMRQAIEGVREKNNIEIPQSLAAAAQQKDVDKTQKGIMDSFGGLGDDIAAIASGVTGGATVGAIGGVPGAVVGGVVGGLGAWLNRDDISEQIASAYEISKQAYDDDRGNMVGDTASAVKQWAGVYGRSIAPFSNLARGLMDSDRGNGIGALQEEDKPSWAKPLDIAATIADMGITFGSTAGIRAYTAQMGAYSAGSVTELTAGTGYRWDPQAGEFRNVYENEKGEFSLANASGAWASTGIDIAQLAMVRGVASKITGAETKMVGKEIDGKVVAKVEERAGRTFYLDDTGTAIGSKINIGQAFVPSEGVQLLAAGGAARGAAMKAGAAGQTSVDDLYKASVSLTRAEAPIKAALVNSIGEGTEEAAQEALDTWSFDHQVQLQTLAEAYAYGAASGLGMGLAMNYRTRSNDAIEMKQLTREGFELQHGAISDKEWNELYKRGLTEEQKKGYRANNFTAEQRAAIKKALGTSVAEQGGSTASGLLITNAVAKAMELEQEKLTNVAGVSGRVIQRIGANTFQSLAARDDDGSVLISNGAVADDSSSTGFTGLLTQYREKRNRLPEILKSLDRQIAEAEAVVASLQEAGADTAQAEAQVAELQATREMWAGTEPTLEKIIKEFEAIAPVMTRSGGQGLEEKREQLDRINQYLDNLYRSDDLSVAVAAARFMLRSPYDNVGSFRVAAPALDWTMIRDNFDGTDTMDWAALDTTTADFDGDRVTGTPSLVLTTKAFRNARTGLTWLNTSVDKNGSSVTTFKVTSNEHDAALATNMHLVHKEMRTPAAQESPGRGIEKFVELVTARYELTKAEARSLEEHLVANVLDAQTEKPIEALMEYLAQSENTIAEKLGAYAEKNKTNEPSAIAGIYRAAVDQAATEINAARVAEMEPAKRRKAGNPKPNLYNVGQTMQSQQGATLYSTFLQYYGTQDSLRIGQVLRQSTEDYTDTDVRRAELNPLLITAGAELRELAKGKIDAAYDGGLDPFDVPARVHEMALDITNGNHAEAFDLLTMKFGQASWDGKQTVRAEYDVTVAQALTDAVVTQLRRQGALAISRDVDLQRKMDLLEAAARDTQSGSESTRSNGESLILRDALGMFNVADVAGIGSTAGWETTGLLPMGTITQNIRILGQHERPSRTALRRSMEAAIERSPEPETYKTMVALIHELANAEYSIDRTTGKVHGRVADRNQKAAESAREIRRNVINAVHALGLDLTHEGIVEALSTQNGPQIFEAFVKQTGVASYTRNSAGDLVPRKWVLDYFMEPDDGVAEVLLWRNRANTLLHLSSLRKKAPEDSLALLMTYLRETNPVLSAKLEIELDRATSREALEEWINKNAVTFRAPVLMFENSVSQFDPSLASGGWADAQQSYGSDIREVLETSRTFLTRSEELVDRRTTNISAANGILHLIEVDPNNAMVAAAQRRYNEAVNSNLVMTLDPNDIRESGVMIHEFGQEMYTKGADLEAIRAYAAQQVAALTQSGRADPFVDSTNMMLGTLDIAVLRDRPELIFSTAAFIDEYGRKVIVPKLTTQVTLDDGSVATQPDIRLVMKAIANDKKTGLADLLVEAGLPRAFKYNKQADISTVVYRGPRNLQELFEQRYDKSFARSAGRYTSEANMAFAAEVSAAAQVEDQAQVAAFERAALVVATPRILSASTSQSITDIGNKVDDSHEALATVIRMAGQFINSEEGSEQAYHDQVMEAAGELVQAQVAAQRLRQEQSGRFRSLTTSLRAEVKNSLMEGVERSALADVHGEAIDSLIERIDAGRLTQKQADALLEELINGRASAPVVRLLQSIKDNNPYAEFEYIYGTAEVQNEAQRKNIVAHIRERNLAGKVLHDPAAAKAVAYLDDPSVSYAAYDWETLRNIALSDQIQTEANPVNAESDFLVVFKEPLRQDPTFSTQFKALLLPDSPLIKAAVKVTRDHPVPVDTVAMRAAMDALFPTDGSIRWDQSVGAMTEALDSTYPSISAGQAATIHGNPGKTADAMAMAARTNTVDVPPAEYLRTVTVKRTPEGLQVRNADGLRIDDNILDGAIGIVADRDLDPMVVEGLVKPYQAMTLARLERALAVGEEMPVQYFDPMHRPSGAKWHNSIYFDGVAAHNSPIVPDYPSLIGWLYMQPNGITQRGTRFTLDAVKKNLPALYKTAISNQGDMDLTAVPDPSDALLALAQMLVGTELGYGTLGSAALRPVLKYVIMRHVVVYDDGSATSVYEYLARQAADPEGIKALKPRMVSLSERTANTLYGEVGVMGLRGFAPTGRLSYGQQLFSWDALSERQQTVLRNLAGPGVKIGATSAARRSALGEVSRGQQTAFRTASRDFSALYELQGEQAAVQQDRFKRLHDLGTTIETMRANQRATSNRLLKEDQQASGLQTWPDSELESLVTEMGQRDAAYATAASYDLVLANQGDLRDGIVTPATLSAFRKSLGEATFGDSITLALDDFTDQDITQVEKVVRYMIGRKVTITVRGGKSSNVRTAVRDILAQTSDYTKVEGQNGTFAPIESVAAYAMERSYISRAMEQRNTTAESRLLTFIPDEGQPGFNGIGESAAAIINPGTRRVVRGVLMKQFASQYLTPVHRVEASAVRDLILSDGFKEALRAKPPRSESAGMSHEDAVNDLLRRAKDKALPLNTPGLNIRKGMFEVYVVNPAATGDQIKVYLHRVGDKFIKDSELSAFRRKQTGGFILSRKSETEKNQTIVEGRVVGSKVRADGLLLDVASDQFWRNNKLIPHLGGNKVMTQGLAEDLSWLRQNIAKDLSIDLVTNATDSAKKLSMMDSVRNFGSAAELLGFDNMAVLYQGMYDEVYDSTDSSAQEKMRALRSMLTAVAQNNEGNHADVQAMIDMVSMGAMSDSRVIALTAMAQESDAELTNRLGETDLDRPAARVLVAAMAYLTLPNAQLSDIEGAGGFTQSESREPGVGSRRMPDMFTRVYRASDIRDMALEALNGQLEPNVTMLNDYSVRIDHPTGSTFGRLAFTTYSVVGESQGMNYDPTAEQGVSSHDSMILEQAAGSFFANSFDYEAFSQFLSGAMTTDTITPTRLIPESQTDPKLRRLPWWNMGVAQQTYRAMAAKKLSYFFEPLNLSDGGGTEIDVQNTQKAIREFAKTFFLDDSGRSDMHVHAMIRLLLGRPAASNETEVEAAKISLSKIDLALEAMRANYAAGYSPLRRGAVSLMPLEIRNAYIRANMGKAGTIKLRVWTDKKLSGEFADSVDTITKAFFDHSLSDTEANNIDAFNMVMDGVYHQYQQSSADAMSLPVSIDLVRDLKLISADFQAEAALKQAVKRNSTMAEFARENPGALATSLWRSQELLLTPAVMHELTNSATIAQQIGMNDLIPGEGLAPTAEVLDYIETRIAAHNRKNDIPFPTKRSTVALRNSGVAFTDNNNNAHRIMRNLLALHAGKALFNPPLAIGAMVDSSMRRGVVDVRRLVTGESIGFVGRRLASVVESQGAVGALARGFGWRTMYTPKQMEDVKRILNTTALTGPMSEVIFADLASYSAALNEQDVWKPIRWLNRMGTAMQDLGHGTKGKTMRSNYLQAAIADAVLRQGADLDTVLAGLSYDGAYLSKEFPDSHNAGVQAMNDLRGVQETVISSAISSVIRPLTHSGNAGVNAVAQMTLAMPLMFQRYAANLFLTLTGARALDQLAAHALNGRMKPGFWNEITSRAKSQGTDLDPAIDMTDVIGGLDAMDAIINMGITHSLLFTGGLVVGGLGLSGEDEEERRRRRAAAAQGAVWLSDPRELENDFRNAHALFLDKIPGLNVLFANDAGRAVVSPHWILKPLTSPLLGMERFFETGDIRQLKWGFEDAINSMPLLNMVTFNKAVTMSEELSHAAQDAAASGNLGASDSAGFLTHLVSYYESALFESSFLNALYTGFDDYDRDPYVMPLRDAEGNLMRDAEGNVRANSDQHLRSEGLDGRGLALQTYVDDDGKVQQGYWTESGATTSSRILAENRLSYALVSSLITGLSGKGLNTRYDMAVKTRSVDKPELSEQEQQAIVLGQYVDQAMTGLTKEGKQSAEQAVALSFLSNMGEEILTEEGAMAIFRGLAGGTVTSTDQALQGVYIDFDTRKAIQEKFFDELTMEGMKLGLSESQAKYRAGRVMKGDGNLPGMAEIIFDKEIPYSKTQEFQQLNTTYMRGPDGNIWATGFTRQKLMGALGLAPLQGQYTSNDTHTGMDGRLNVAGFGINNTGQRALRPVNDSLDTPTPAEIGDAITKAIEDLDLRDYSGGYGRGGFRGFGGGGGGGYAQRPVNPYDSIARWTNQNFNPVTLRVPYANDVYAIQTDNIRTDYSGIRRERISSERGRLTQWQ